MTCGALCSNPAVLKKAHNFNVHSKQNISLKTHSKRLWGALKYSTEIARSDCERIPAFEVYLLRKDKKPLNIYSNAGMWLGWSFVKFLKIFGYIIRYLLCL